MVWLPRFGKIHTDKQFLKEYIKALSQLKNNKYYMLLRNSCAGWVERLTKDEEIINYMKERLDMMSIYSPEFKDYIATAIYERELEIIIKEKDAEISELKKKRF